MRYETMYDYRTCEWGTWDTLEALFYYAETREAAYEQTKRMNQEVKNETHAD